MLYTVLPGLTLCMTLMKGNTSSLPAVNVPSDFHNGNTTSYDQYLDAAMILIQAAKQMKIRRESNDREDVLEGKQSDADDDDDDASYTDPVESGADRDKELGDPPLRCPSRPIDCEELLLLCKFTTSGVYRIWPHSRVDTGGDLGFDVYCDMITDGGGWTVIQRRDDFGTGSDFFYQNWLSYKYGFGNVNFDFWLGNNKIFALSNQRRTTLRIDVLDFVDEAGYAAYDNFYLDDESFDYRLHIGYYRGNIGDSLRGHNLCRFSTKDKDNDNNYIINCAQSYKGGWWYNNCHTANLNGLYLKGDHNSYANGVNWHSWRGFRHSLKKTEMKLRSSTFRKNFNGGFNLNAGGDQNASADQNVDANNQNADVDQNIKMDKTLLQEPTI